MKNIIYLILITILFSACSSPIPSPTSSPIPIPTITNTLAPTATLQPTETIAPTATPTATFTPTISPTSIPLSLFKSLTFIDGLRNSPNRFVGKYIKALGLRSLDAFQYLSDTPSNPYWLAPANYSPLGVYANTEINSSADSTIDKFDSADWLWIYGIIKETKNEYPLLSVIHVESIPNDQLPRGDGVYRVNDDIAPGKWKLMSDATDTQSCYWARITKNGSILDNSFYGGTIVNIYESDSAVEFKNCNVMVYLGK